MFLDRDGVINRVVIKKGLSFPPERLDDFQFLPGVREACRRLKQAGFLLIVVTNQPDVGRGRQSRETVEAMHRKIFERLPIDDLEVCYDSGQCPGAEFKKPSPKMVFKAATTHHINLSESYLIGDRWSDIDCGHAAGCKTIFIDYGYEEALRQRPDYSVKSLDEAVKIIRLQNPSISTGGPARAHRA